MAFRPQATVCSHTQATELCADLLSGLVRVLSPTRDLEYSETNGTIHLSVNRNRKYEVLFQRTRCSGDDSFGVLHTSECFRLIGERNLYAL